MNPKLPGIIAVDLDGTVFSADHETILPYTYGALASCVRRGAELVPTTGRSESAIPFGAFPPVRYVISCNGGLISDRKTGAILRVRYIPKEDAERAWEIIKERTGGSGAVLEFFEEKQIVVERRICENIGDYAGHIPKFHLSYIRDGRAKCVSSFDAYIKNEGGHIVKINFPGESARECPELRGRLAGTGLFDVTSDGLNLEVVKKGCNKGEALMWLSDYLGVPRSGTMAFGDGHNDLTMLNSAGWGVAMGNAADDVKAAAVYCTASNVENGIAAFLEKTLCCEEEKNLTDE